MYPIKIAINGFGRIGRLVFRELFTNQAVEIVAINDLSNIQTLVHLLKYDTAQGTFLPEISHTKDTLQVGAKTIKVFAEKNPSLLPWRENEIDLVVESTGFFTEVEQANKHIEAGAKKVLISAAAKGDVKMIVYNVNHKILDGKESIISCASCTTNCLAPMVQVLHEKFGIKTGIMNTVHAYTSDQNLIDANHAKGDLRRARAAAENIVPTTTGAAKAIGKVLPALDGVLTGGAHRVPTVSGSLTELYCVLEKETSVEEINAAMKNAQNDSFGYTEDPIVSSDIIGCKYGSLFDAELTTVMEANGQQLVKTVSWYDNEMSYVAQLIRTLLYWCEKSQNI
ncbi:MAG TPA: type I glyceraldehyde-3-phosphate dehydrogenase [Chitinophagaceae bacterium]|nr:type I glyceraldehyde-3-phosphate dehydrogenase [Chitinophagaceae bacterium]